MGVFSFLEVCVLRQCSRCKQEKEIDQFGKGSCKDGLCGWCKQCMAEYNRIRQADPEYRERQRKWSTNNKRHWRQDASFREKENKWTAKRIARLLITSPEKIKEYRKTHIQRRKERRANDERTRAAEKAYYYKRKNAIKNGGNFTKDEWCALCRFYDNKCLACGQKKPLTVDHVIPLSLGGSNEISNIQPLCMNCNASKGAKIIDYR